jgi:hypothetical protein
VIDQATSMFAAELVRRRLLILNERELRRGGKPVTAGEWTTDQRRTDVEGRIRLACQPDGTVDVDLLMDACACLLGWFMVADEAEQARVDTGTAAA